MDSPPINEVFGSYRLTHLLGRGGMASVYRAVRSGPMGFAKQVAIKRLHSSLTRDSAILKALVNEARIGGQLKHPNIVEIYEFNRVEDTYYLAMEFIDGWTLDRVMELCQKYQQPLPHGVVLDLCIEVCEGLHYAHTLESLDGVEVHLVHRDLKPANIIIGSDGVTKIMDFGIAKADTNLFKTTMVDTTKGTPHYMSPEQVAGDPNLGPTSDIFALGSLLYELVSGRVLFGGDSLAAVLFAVARAEVADKITDIESTVPGLGTIVGRCLDKDPTKRFPSAKALGNALEKLRDSRDAGPWTTLNFMYTLRSKLLDESARAESSDGPQEMDFLPLVSKTDSGITDDVSVEEARAAADAEINKLQSQYLNEAMTRTIGVAEIDEPTFDETLLPGAATASDAPRPRHGPNQKVLVALLAVALMITLAVILGRMGGDRDSKDLTPNEQTAASALPSDSLQGAPTAVPTSGPSVDAEAEPSLVAKQKPAAESGDGDPIRANAGAATVASASSASNEASAAKAASAGSTPSATNPPPAKETGAATTSAPTGIGKLGVRPSSPSSVVYIDGKRVGKTPLMPMELSAGQHTVRLDCATDGIKATKSISVNIEPGKTLKLGKYDFKEREWK